MFLDKTMHRLIISMLGVMVLTNVFLGLRYNYQYSEFINISLGLILVIISSRYFSKKKLKKE